MITVTKTFLPPQEEYQAILKESWEAGWITNRGPLVKKLEAKLMKHLDVPYVLALTNGTIPLQIAIKALGLTGEIITTPFSYVATTSSIVWEGCTPVFVDIHPKYLTIDETKIEAAITSKTSAILATHVYGNPCHIEEIEIIAKKHNLKVIYDAAHCFDINYNGKSIFNYGDISTCSFHATKLFHTGEGGALFTNNSDLQNTLFYHHNFGHKGNEEFFGIGINGKMSEPQAAMGLAVLPYIEDIKAGREKVVNLYNNAFQNSNSLQLLTWRNGTDLNYAYFPIILKDEEILLKVMDLFEAQQIFPRRYFFPSLNTMPYLEYSKMPVAESIAKRVLCLPLYYGMDLVDVQRIIDVIKKVI
ncbi:DegT/DnrJ/EryC1/StrS family aminotransferase [Ulvibacter antarcticus]|uniref:dTDP-4-amino-4,6-dideoxygalactose transaminase n=1 Tax=Ulvibacter antarcticus TaxID=442714 RepID=A0A3L9YIJ3_9FLAO|nr:DegT/DnrJ/EryC1/StrS family aminotransferase [Ulvibacter antarcticus]RMA57965.1 dTDP-4-amino-4,6-dideoxygalactose transaminase [Ulvibacter antarcticus]